MAELHNDERIVNMKIKLDPEVAEAYWDAVNDVGAQRKVIVAALEMYLKNEGYLFNDEDWYEYD